MESMDGIEAISGIEQCSLSMPVSPPLRAASECEIVGASVAIRIANNPSQLPIFRWKRLKMRSATRLETVANYAMAHRACWPVRRRSCQTFSSCAAHASTALLRCCTAAALCTTIVPVPPLRCCWAITPPHRCTAIALLRYPTDALLHRCTAVALLRCCAVALPHCCCAVALLRCPTAALLLHGLPPHPLPQHRCAAAMAELTYRSMARRPYAVNRANCQRQIRRGQWTMPHPGYRHGVSMKAHRPRPPHFPGDHSHAEWRDHTVPYVIVAALVVAMVTLIVWGSIRRRHRKTSR